MYPIFYYPWYSSCKLVRVRPGLKQYSQLTAESKRFVSFRVYNFDIPYNASNTAILVELPIEP